MLDDVKRKGVMTEIVSRLVALERAMRESKSISTLATISGTYTPTLAIVENLSAASVVQAFSYTRVGKIVSVSGVLSLTHDGSGLGTVSMTLPISSAFTAQNDCVGVSSSVGPSIDYSGIVYGSAADDLIRMSISDQVGTSALDWRLVFHYEVK